MGDTKWFLIHVSCMVAAISVGVLSIAGKLHAAETQKQAEVYAATDGEEDSDEIVASKKTVHDDGALLAEVHTADL